MVVVGAVVGVAVAADGGGGGDDYGDDSDDDRNKCSFKHFSWGCGPECNEKRETEEADSCRYEPTVSAQLTIPHVPVSTHVTSCLVSPPALTFGSCLGCRVRKTL